MPESKKKRKTCQFEVDDYKCRRKLYDEKHCIFHSWDNGGKNEAFMSAFEKEYESQKKKKQFIFTGFVFPIKVNLKELNLEKVNLQHAYFLGLTYIE